MLSNIERIELMLDRTADSVAETVAVIVLAAVAYVYLIA